MKQKFFFEQCPKQKCNELDEEKFEKIRIFYDSMYKKSYVYRMMFDVVCSIDKTLLTLIAGSLTSLSINLATSVINLEKNYFSVEFIFRILQFVFAVGFNVYTICFAAKVINIQEHGEKYYPNQIISKKLINKAQKNVMFYACMDSKDYFKKIIFRSGICFMAFLVSIFFRLISAESIIHIILPLIYRIIQIFF